MEMEGIHIFTWAELGVITLIFFVYFLPSLIGFMRNHKNKLAIFLLNLLWGWTIRGWTAALIWSVTK